MSWHCDSSSGANLIFVLVHNAILSSPDCFMDHFALFCLAVTTLHVHQILPGAVAIGESVSASFLRVEAVLMTPVGRCHCLHMLLVSAYLYTDCLYHERILYLKCAVPFTGGNRCDARW